MDNLETYFVQGRDPSPTIDLPDTARQANICHKLSKCHWENVNNYIVYRCQTWLVYYSVSQNRITYRGEHEHLALCKFFWLSYAHSSAYFWIQAGNLRSFKCVFFGSKLAISIRFHTLSNVVIILYFQYFANKFRLASIDSIKIERSTSKWKLTLPKVAVVIK